jgi:hypothetical protein
MAHNQTTERNLRVAQLTRKSMARGLLMTFVLTAVEDSATLFAANRGDWLDPCRTDRRQQGSGASDGGKRRNGGE